MSDPKFIAIGGARDGQTLRACPAPKVMVPEGEYQRYDLACPDGYFSFYVADGMPLNEALKMLALAYIENRGQQGNRAGDLAAALRDLLSTNFYDTRNCVYHDDNDCESCGALDSARHVLASYDEARDSLTEAGMAEVEKYERENS